MKTLSLWQPWAILVVLGAKQWETRSWPTSYRGRLLIHAAKHWTADERFYCIKEPFRSVLEAAGFYKLSDLPLGKIIGAVTVDDCLRTETIRGELSLQEQAFGNYSDDRFAHKYINPVRFARPTEYRGAQGYFNCNLPLETLEQQ